MLVSSFKAVPEARGSRGFTLIELMVVVALIAVLATLAAPSIRHFAANQQLKGVTSELASAAMMARNTAMNRNREVALSPKSNGDWLTGWDIYIRDADGNNEELILHGTPVPDTVKVGTSCTKKNQFVYGASGFLVGAGNGGVPFESAVTGRERCVLFNRMGRTRICGTGIDSC